MKLLKFIQKGLPKVGKDLKKAELEPINIEGKEETNETSLIPNGIMSIIQDLFADLYVAGMTRSDRVTNTHTIRAYTVGKITRIDIIPKGAKE